MKVEADYNIESADRLVKILTETERVTEPIMECAGYGGRFDKYNWTQVGETEVDRLKHNFDDRRAAYFRLKSMIKNSEDRKFRKKYKKHFRKISKPRTIDEQNDMFMLGCAAVIGIPTFAFLGLYGYAKYVVKTSSP